MVTTQESFHRPTASSVDDASYIDFTVGFRGFGLSRLNRKMFERGAALIGDEHISSMKALRELMDPQPVVALRNRLLRSQQEMTWARILDTLEERQDELLRQLDEAETRGPGSVSYDPDFKYPDWYLSTDIHLQPGNYQGHPLAGYVYHYGTNVFYAGRNDNNELKQQTIDKAPIPPDGRVTAVLDLACSVGQSAIAFKTRFPEARVVGIDIAMPMVRYAHLLATSMGVDVEFRQESADSLSFPDETFDIVYVNILFHEVPRSVANDVIAEAHRVLRPGGVFVVHDFKTRPAEGPLGMNDYHRDIDTKYNGEPFATPFVYGDFENQLAEYFDTIDPDVEPDPTGVRQMRVCVK
jgi:ubiquinone/menaquinone biosynthesis C-methylase UbiE